MKFIIFHGSFGGPEGNWFPQLKEKLEALGQKVVVPEFPVEDWEELTKAGPGVKPCRQSFKPWVEVFDRVWKNFKKGEKLCFVGHSLGPLFILHLVDKYNLQLDSAIFVSPFLRELGRFWQIDLVNESFYRTDFNFPKIKKLIPISYVLYSDNDPYVDKKLSMEFAEKTGSSLIFVRRAGHMNSEVNLNEFPLVYELCKTRIDLSLYQKYLAHRAELFSVDYIKGRSEEVIYIDPKEVFDEGLFHFRNLRRGGFCTFYTALRFWDIHAKYYEESRKAARRVGNLIRVFVVDKIADLRRPRLLEHIKLDIASGTKVYLCLYDEVKKLVPEPDFGIWDGDYVCIVRFDAKKREVNEVEVSSRRRDIEEARGWKKEILKRAVGIDNVQEDIEKFIRKLPSQRITSGVRS